jgi:hypothetical protein
MSTLLKQITSSGLRHFRSCLHFVFIVAVPRRLSPFDCQVNFRRRRLRRRLIQSGFRISFGREPISNTPFCQPFSWHASHYEYRYVTAACPKMFCQSFSSNIRHLDFRLFRACLFFVVVIVVVIVVVFVVESRYRCQRKFPSSSSSSSSDTTRFSNFIWS